MATVTGSTYYVMLRLTWLPLSCAWNRVCLARDSTSSSRRPQCRRTTTRLALAILHTEDYRASLTLMSLLDSTGIHVSPMADSLIVIQIWSVTARGGS